MKKRYIFLICLVLLFALLAGGLYWHCSTYIQIEGEYLRRDISELTLAGSELPEAAVLQQLTALEYLDARNIDLSIAEYEQLRAQLPQCRIEWNVPFQDTRLNEHVETLSVSTISFHDLESIAYLPSLKTINADNCPDYDVLMALKNIHPQLELHYHVPLQNHSYGEDTVSLTLANADIEELRAALPYLPKLSQVTFTENTPENEAIYQLMCDYPHIEFFWNLDVFGVETPNTATELVLSGIPMESTVEVESYLKYFSALERVEMCDCGISSEEMDALSERWPDIRFVWTIHIGRAVIRTDAVSFVPWKYNYNSKHPLYDKDVTDLKYCVDMVALDLGHMKISDISFLKNMPKMKYLIVGELPCPDFSPMADLKELIYLEIFNTTFKQQEILLELPKLQDLNMGSTKVYGTSVLKQMTWLKRLWLAGTGLSFAEYDELVAALPDTQVVMHIPHSTAGGWRDHQNYRDMRDLQGMFYMD